MVSDFLNGRLLIAMPGIDDPRFERAVILMCIHNADEAMGVAVNRPLDEPTAAELFEHLGLAAADPAPGDPILIGGPVDPVRGFVVHTDDYQCEASTVRVCDGVALTPTREVLEAMSDQARRPRRAILALGYAGWGAGQLEQELQQNIWLTCEADEALIFGGDHEHKWSQALGKIGVSPEQLSGQAGRA